MTMLSERQQMSYIAAQAADARLNVELETEGRHFCRSDGLRNPPVAQEGFITSLSRIPGYHAPSVSTGV